MKKKIKIIHIISLLCYLTTVNIFKTNAQISTIPSLWISFDHLDANNFFDADISLADFTCMIPSNKSVTMIQDRFNNSSAASVVNNVFKCMTEQIDETGDVEYTSPILFDGFTSIPENFTVSCWIYATPVADNNIVRRIFYNGQINSSFALFMKGSNLYLRRYTEDSNKTRYNYRFWAPASLDAGDGWYHIILVMGKRKSDNVGFTKLYVGKPQYVQYNPNGLILSASNDDSNPLISNFGGGYAYLGSQDLIDDLSGQWGVGVSNTENNKDEIFGNDIQSVRGIDDFLVWNTILNDSSSKALFDCMQSQKACNCWKNASTESEKTVISTEKTDGLTENIKESSKLSIYPNPSDGNITVTFTAQSQCTSIFSLENVTGQTISSIAKNTAVGYNKFELNFKLLEQIPAGLYILKIETKEFNFNKKVLIK